MSRGAAGGSLPASFASLIGLIDLPMPEKTQRCSSRIHRCTRLPLELFWRPIAQRRMQAAPIVVLFDERFEVRKQMFQIAVLVRVFLLPLQRLPRSTLSRFAAFFRW